MSDQNRAPKWIDGLPRCSFCGGPQAEVERLVAGPGVYICVQCVELCNEIIQKERSLDG